MLEESKCYEDIDEAVKLATKY